MKIQIHAPWEVNDYLEGVIYKKLEKLNTYYGRILRADVYLKMKDDDSYDGKMVEINLHVPINDLFAKDTAESFEKAVASVANKLERQLKKRKEKLSPHS